MSGDLTAPPTPVPAPARPGSSRARRRHPAVPRGPRAGAALPLRPRSWVVLALASLVGLTAFVWPLLVRGDGALADPLSAPLVLAVVLLGVVAVVAVSVADGGLDVRAVAVLGLLAGVGTVLRPLSAGTAGVELVFLVIVLGGRVFGPGFGFALGATTILSSALLTGGVGPWMPFQMLAAAWMGLGAGLLPRAAGRREVALLCAYGALAALAYGLVINMAFWPFAVGTGTGVSFIPGDPVVENLRRYGLYLVGTSLLWDLGRAVTMVLGLAVLGRPVLDTLARTARRARFVD